MKMLCLGAVLCDIAAKPVPADAFAARRIQLDSLNLAGGGDANNASIDLARLGEDVRIVSRVGGDFLGQMLTTLLSQNGVDTRYVARDEHAETTAAILMLGPDGVVMESTSQIDLQLDVPVITGASIKSARVGEAVTYSVAGQDEAVALLLEAIDWQGFTSEVSEINVAALDDLYLVTQDGLIIRLGSAENIDEKLALARATLKPIRSAYEVRGAVLDVSTGVHADFRPL